VTSSAAPHALVEKPCTHHISGTIGKTLHARWTREPARIRLNVLSDAGHVDHSVSIAKS
jgi:hypothetical protein